MSALRTAAPAQALLCVTIDCERDKGPGWRVRRPAAFQGIHQGIGARLDPLFRHFGVKPTYLLSPEVIRDDAAATRMAQLARGGGELGTHLHAEYIDPDSDEGAESSLFQAALPAPLERAKIEALTALYARTFGGRPRSFRAGRFGIGAASLGILADLGYAVDSSVTPFVDWTGAGPGAPDFRGAPVAPYRPEPGAPAARGDGSGPLWEVPLTIRPRVWHRLPLVGRAFDRRLRARWLRPTWGSSRAMIDLARDVWHEAQGAARSGTRPLAPPIWNVMFHNVEVVAGASPYAATENEAQAIVARLAELLAFARAAGARSVGLGDLPDLLPDLPPELLS